MKNLQKGFTLIELLVVIAIIGILSSIVLASLSSARSKGEDAAIKTTLSNMRAQAELYYSNNSTYTSVSQNDCDNAAITAAGTIFGTSTVGGLNALRKGLVDKAGTGAKTSCVASSTSWAAAALLKSGGTSCADSSGASVSSTTAATAAAAINTNTALCY